MFNIHHKLQPDKYMYTYVIHLINSPLFGGLDASLIITTKLDAIH